MAHMTVFSSAYASAQPLCAAFSCPEMTNIALILDAGLLLASIIICSLILLVNKTSLCRIPVQRLVSPSIR